MRASQIPNRAGQSSGRRQSLFRLTASGAFAGALLAVLPFGAGTPSIITFVHAQSEQELTLPDSKPPGLRDDARTLKDKKKKAGQDKEGSTPADDKQVAQQAAEDDKESLPAEDDLAAQAQEAEVVEPINPGEAVVTRFSHTVDGMDAAGRPIKVIDVTGISASILDIRNASEAPTGQHWLDEPQRMFITASDVGQVFGVAIAQREGEQAPTIFLSATAAYGLHRLGKDWMDGMWGADGGPGTIWRLSAANGYKPEKFADVMLDGRENSGASLGNIAYDKVHDRLLVSDLETGMIHSIDAATGNDIGRFDHGNDGRVAFLDVWSQQQLALDSIGFDPSTSANTEGCVGNFTGNPACWNLADFRRRVWGLKVRTDEAGQTRLFYSVWGSDAFGNPAWAKAGDDRRNAVWSVALTEDGLFDTTSVRREYFMPAFWPSDPSFGQKAGNSSPVSDITFPECVPQNVMLVAERGGMRNLGLDTPEAFARPYESRVMRYEIGQDEIWRPVGRYDVGFHERASNEGEPLLFANAAGGVDFDYKIDESGVLDESTPSQSVWMTGDGLCSPMGACSDRLRGASADKSQVHGLQGTPFEAIVPLEQVVQASTDLSGLLRSYMIDTDINIDEDGKPVAEELARNDATKIGDVAIYQVCQAAEPLPAVDVPPVIADDFVEIAEPPEDFPVHSLNASHNKWASTSHRVRSSWHYRNGSWHDARRSWHWRDGSWHQNNRSWHRRNGSWHDRVRSWHYKSRSFHSKRQTWGDDHRKGRSYHFKGRTWGDDHRKGRSYHFKGRTWGNVQPDHRKGRSYHLRGRTWDGAVIVPVHKKRQSTHVKGRTYVGDKPIHTRKRSLADTTKPKHLRSRSRGDHVDVHTRRESRAVQNPKPKHLRSRSRGDQHINQHSRRESRGVQNHNQPTHSRRASRGNQHQNVNQHSRRESRGVSNKQHNDNREQHGRRRSMAQGG